MPKFTIANFLKALSVFADVVSILYILLISKDMSICNIVVSIFFYSFYCTLLFFLIPFIWVKLMLKSEKIMFTVIAVALSIAVIFYWNKISDNSNCIIPKKEIKQPPAPAPAKKIIDIPKVTPIKSVASHRNIKDSKLFVKNKSVASRKDTSKTQVPAPQLNQVTQTGKNNFNGGNAVFNAPVHNGDVISEPELTKEIENYLIEGIEAAKKRLNIQSNGIELDVYSQSNSSKLYGQAKQFLILSGYTIIGEGNLYGDAAGITFDSAITRKNVSVKIGRVAN